MDAKNQFAYFCLSLAIGLLGGLAYEPFSWARLLIGCEKGKNKVLGIVLDILFFILFACGCIAGSFLWKFPSFRAYTWLGYAVGAIIYLKTLHRILAIPKKMCYNKLIGIGKKIKTRKKTLKKGRSEL